MMIGSHLYFKVDCGPTGGLTIILAARDKVLASKSQTTAILAEQFFADYLLFVCLYYRLFKLVARLGVDITIIPWRILD